MYDLATFNLEVKSQATCRTFEMTNVGSKCIFIFIYMHSIPHPYMQLGMWAALNIIDVHAQ